MDSKEIGNNGYQNNNIKANNSDTKRVKGYGLLEGIKNFFRNLHLSRVFSKSLLSRKAEVQGNQKNATNSLKGSNVVIGIDQNSVEDVDENYLDKESERIVKDSLDTNKYSEDDPKTMNINGIQMSKIKVGDNVYVLPKGMYEKSNVDAEEAAKRIDSGKQIYEKIKDNKNKGENGFVIIDSLSKEDVSNLVWFLEYKACRKNTNYSSNSSNMRIPDNDGKIYMLYVWLLTKIKMMQQEESMEEVVNGCLAFLMNHLILKPKMRKKLKNLRLV